jgi:hypothetical protein
VRGWAAYRDSRPILSIFSLAERTVVHVPCIVLPHRRRPVRPRRAATSREAVAWRVQNPHGTAEEMVAAIGHRFHRDYAAVLRAVLFAADRRQARAVTGTAAVSAIPRPGLS